MTGEVSAINTEKINWVYKEEFDMLTNMLENYAKRTDIIDLKEELTMYVKNKNFNDAVFKIEAI